MSPISVGPIRATNYSVISQSRKLEKPNCIICAKRQEFLGKLGCKRTVSWAIRRENRKTTMGLNWARARNSEHEEGVNAFEQQALVAANGLGATLNNLSKWLVAFLFVGIVLWRHDTVALWATVGSVINNVLSITLKNTLKHDRPIPALRSDPGMPSSHTQSIFYTITFLNLSLKELYGINGHTIALSGISFILGSYLSWLRISQRLHTISQVIVGAVVGSIFSMFWFWSWNAYVLDLFGLYLPVKILVALGAFGFSLAFVNFVIKCWIFMDDER